VLQLGEVVLLFALGVLPLGEVFLLLTLAVSGPSSSEPGFGLGEGLGFSAPAVELRLEPLIRLLSLLETQICLLLLLALRVRAVDQPCCGAVGGGHGEGCDGCVGVVGLFVELRLLLEMLGLLLLLEVCAVGLP
jgi:hypothetical protein